LAAAGLPRFLDNLVAQRVSKRLIVERVYTTCIAFAPMISGIRSRMSLL
jgi:hypothetical protein